MKEQEYFQKMMLYYLKGLDKEYNCFSSIITESLIKSYGQEMVESYLLSNAPFTDDEYQNKLLNRVILNLNENKKSFHYYFQHYLDALMYLYFSSQEEKVSEVEYINFLYQAFSGKVHCNKDLKKELERKLLYVKTTIMLKQAVQSKERRGIK